MFCRLLLAGILAATLASAQRGGGGRGASTSPLSAMGGQADKLAILTDNLKLNKDQKAEAQTVLMDAMKESAPLRQQLMQSRVEIVKAMLGGASADDLKKTMDTYATVAAQVTGVETKAFAKVCATLKPNQQGKAASAFELMAGMFDFPAGGGAGGRAGGRRGRD